MSFFGGNNTLGATSTPAKPNLFSGFGTGTSGPNAFGTTTNTGAAPTAFGQPAANTGATLFGQPAPGTAATPFGAAATTSAFGTGATTSAFGTSTAPAFGNTGFGAAPTATVAPTLGGFGTTTASAAPFGGFGTSNVAASAPSIFAGTGSATTTGFGGFGSTAPAATSAPLFSGFGTTSTSAAATGFGGFGTTATTTTAPAFGGFGTGQTNFGGFGNTFGKPATSTVTPGFGGFTGTTNFMLGQPQQQAPQITPDEAFAQSIFNVNIFGDERDAIIAKWNYLQAMWGTGKAFYSQTAPPVEITPDNYLCRFKAMGYSRLPGKDNKVGHVAINIGKPLKEVKLQTTQIVTVLNGIFGNKPNLTIHIDHTKEIDEKKTQIVIYVEERNQLAPNEVRRILATDLSNFLNQPAAKPQLNNLSVIEILALVRPDIDQLKEYLANPPKGIDPRMWRQAIADNPDSTEFIPVPIIGFDDLKWRIKCQDNETETHSLYLKKVENDLTQLRQRHTAATAKIIEHKRKLAELSHNILKIIVKQESTRRVGLALTPEEEALRTKLENMQATVSAPTQFKGRLSELLSQMRMQGNQYTHVGRDYKLDKDSEDELKSFLSMQQKAMEVLTDTVTKDMKALQIIIDGLPDLLRK